MEALEDEVERKWNILKKGLDNFADSKDKYHLINFKQDMTKGPLKIEELNKLVNKIYDKYQFKLTNITRSDSSFGGTNYVIVLEK